MVLLISSRGHFYYSGWYLPTVVRVTRPQTASEISTDTRLQTITRRQPLQCLVSKNKKVFFLIFVKIVYLYFYSFMLLLLSLLSLLLCNELKKINSTFKIKKNMFQQFFCHLQFWIIQSTKLNLKGVTKCWLDKTNNTNRTMYAFTRKVLN